MHLFYMCNKLKNAKISLFPTKCKLLFKEVRENQINSNPRISARFDLQQSRNPRIENEVEDWNP